MFAGRPGTQALLEAAQYDGDGRLATSNWMTYPCPRASNVPHIETGHTVTPSPLNEMGVKGVGEAGAIAAPPAIVNAVLDALAPLGVTDLDIPLTAEHARGDTRSARSQDGTGGWPPVIPATFDYQRPSTLGEALAALASNDMKHRRARPRLLVDLSRLEELRGITLDAAGGTVTIGAMTTSAEIEHSAEVAAAVPLMSRAASEISDPLICNRATLGGSLVCAEARGDWPAVAVACSATVRVRDRSGERDVAIDTFLRSAEAFRAIPARGIVVSISMPVHTASMRSVYLKHVHPASGYAMLGVAIAADLQDGVCRACRVGLAGAEVRRAEDLERALTGRPLDTGTSAAAEATATQLAPALGFIDDVNVSGAYRADVFPIYVRRAVAALR